MREELNAEFEKLINILKKKNDDDDEKVREIIDDILNKTIRYDIKKEFFEKVKDYKSYIEENQPDSFAVQKLTELQSGLEEQLTEEEEEEM